MMGTTIACIGSGNMGSALMKGIARTIGGSNIGFADADTGKATAAATELGAKVYNSNIEAAGSGDFIFIAVKPQGLEKVLSEIGYVVLRRLTVGSAPVVVSMAAGWSIEKIQNVIAKCTQVPTECKSQERTPEVLAPVARIMPNTPALVSKGMIALAVSPEVSSPKTTSLKEMLDGAGTVDIVPEHYLSAVTGLSGSGPAFVYMFIEALADGGVLAGLPRDKAIRYAAATVLGSATMVLETGKHPGELKDMVCSPGGTTISGVTALEAGSFRSTTIKAVEAAWRRSLELS
ncbi:MAG: pyrroline-5-carboxylate reductase [Treponema sp.]|nr:pyrroline-5-carboxylate reductase [Treponema sp.]